MQKPSGNFLARQCQMDVNNVMSILDSISLFGGLTGSQLQHLFHAMYQVRYQTGELVFREGEPSSEIYILLDGAVRLVYENLNHPLSRIELQAGACFGETSMIGIQPHSANALVTKDAQLLVLSQATLMDLFSEDKALFSQLVLNIAREASRRLHYCNELLSAYVLDVDDRLQPKSNIRH